MSNSRKLALLLVGGMAAGFAAALLFVGSGSGADSGYLLPPDLEIIMSFFFS
jgi:hypothetical protein